MNKPRTVLEHQTGANSKSPPSIKLEEFGRMRKIHPDALCDNTLPLWRAAMERRYRSLPYPAKRLVHRYGIEPDEALRTAERFGWFID